MPFTVRMNINYAQHAAGAVITDASPTADGVMTAAQAAKLDSLTVPSGGPPGAGAGPIDFAEFYGLTNGTGVSPAPGDYPGTIAVRTTNGTGGVPFPRLGATASGSGITRVSAAGLAFTLAAIGVYEVAWRVHTTEQGQLELVLNNTLLPDTCFANMNPTSGGHPIWGTVLVTTTVVNSVLELVNPNGNSTALTITGPGVSGGTTTVNTNAQTLVIQRIR